MLIAIAGATGLVGREVAAQAQAQGHEVVELTRAAGVDLTAADQSAELEDALTGVTAVIDVTNAGTLDREEGIAFFGAVGEHLGVAATRAGVERTVLLSIIGVEESADENPHYAAKAAHERATLAHAPGVRVLRSAQFHELAGQMIGWNRDGDGAAVPAMPVRPVAMAAIAPPLLDLATGADPRERVEVAGPQDEDLADMAARLAAHDGDAVTITPVPVDGAIARGVLRPAGDALIVGPAFDAWLAARNPSAVS